VDTCTDAGKRTIERNVNMLRIFNEGGRKSRNIGEMDRDNFFHKSLHVWLGIEEL
jgi:hypothetical protein